eukprot:scaffold61515_cov63-Phaeocystis_antarctica.AAC.1
MAALRPPWPPTGRPIFGVCRPIFCRWPPEFGLRAAPFGGVAALVAAGRPADQIGAHRPVTGPRFLRGGGTVAQHFTG